MDQIHRQYFDQFPFVPNDPGIQVQVDMQDEENVENSLPSTPLDDSHFDHSLPGSTEDDDATSCQVNKDNEGAEDISRSGSTNTDEDGMDIPSNSKMTLETKEESQINDSDEEDRLCRICFSGQEEEVNSGKMISPCLCTGSMRHVHVNCLNAWRGTGTNAKAHMECPQCHYRYQLRRTLISGLATSRPILLLSTLISFVSLTLLLGQILHLVLHHSPTISRTLLSRTSRSPVTSIFDLMDDPYGAIDNGPVIVVGGGGALVWDIFIAAIQTFIGISERFSTYRNKLSSNLLISGPLTTFGFELVIRFLLGLAMLGSMSFLSLIFTLSLFGPLQLVNGLRGFGFLGNWGRRRVRTGGGGTNGNGNTSIGTIMIVLLVLIGAVNTLFQVYAGVRSVTHRLLLYVETQILEVNAEEIRQKRKEREKKKRQEKWWIRWFKDGQYMTIQGWKELYIRSSIQFDRLVERFSRGVEENDHQQ
ncbi:uncharacterized protein IL334_006292 [Kwoniella shivajii]|uniref:RING-CH-type domain-containing protein n=1 Tax=Kwoniella shivajii TaxID=564305 RepID=A0ABZ1D5I6_9TREE|nr:hypothetical protein IL334_006292 [Kwoniella shivajii]